MNVINFFHRFVGPPPPTPPKASGAVHPIEQRYWAAPIAEFLDRYRFAHPGDASLCLRGDAIQARIFQGGALAVAHLSTDDWLWVAWLSLELEPSTAAPPPLPVQDFLASYRYWTRAYPGQAESRFDDGRTVAQVLAQSLPPAVAFLQHSFDRCVFDQRLAVFARLDCGSDLPCGESLRALLDLDPPTGMEAPGEWTAQWLQGRLYERWAGYGVLYGFTHHSGFALTSGEPRPWLDRLCHPRWPLEAPQSQGAYFDLALLVFAEAALHVVADTIDREGSVLLNRLLGTFATPIDQGRALLDCWRRAYKRDLLLRMDTEEEGRNA